MALKEYTAACDYASATDQQSNYQVQWRAKQGFDALGAKQESAKAQQWLNDFMASQRGMTTFAP